MTGNPNTSAEIVELFDLMLEMLDDISRAEQTGDPQLLEAVRADWRIIWQEKFDWYSAQPRGIVAKAEG